MGIELLLLGLLAQRVEPIEVHVRRPPRRGINEAVVIMNDGDRDYVLRSVDGRVKFPGPCTRFLKFRAEMPRPRPARFPNPSATVYCSRNSVELWILPS